MKKIKLYNGMFAKVDDEDYDELSRHKWYAARNGIRGYKTRVVPVTYFFKGGPQKAVLMSRMIMGVTYKNLVVDHINHDSLDNQRCNLRVCTHAENGLNREGPNRNNHSGYKGISWSKAAGRWQVTIGVAGKNCHLGVFENIEEAHTVYLKAAKKYHGEFATSFSQTKKNLGIK